LEKGPDIPRRARMALPKWGRIWGVPEHSAEKVPRYSARSGGSWFHRPPELPATWAPLGEGFALEMAYTAFRGCPARILNRQAACLPPDRSKPSRSLIAARVSRCLTEQDEAGDAVRLEGWKTNARPLLWFVHSAQTLIQKLQPNVACPRGRACASV
jgi:hypothetical protein